MMKPFSLLLFLFLSYSSISWGQNLREYLLEAEKNNPSLQASYREYLAALEQAPQVSTLPDPEVTLGVFLSPMERLMGNQLGSVQLMQRFPWFGTLDAKKQGADWQAIARYQSYLDAKNGLFYEVKSAAYNVYRIQEEILIHEKTIEILSEYERLALVTYQVGSTENSSMNSKSMPSSSKKGMADILEIRMEILALNSQLETLQDELTPSGIAFNQLLNREKQAPIPTLPKLTNPAWTTDKEAVLEQILAQNPLLEKSDAELAALEQSKKVTRLEGSPSLAAGVEYMPFQTRVEGNSNVGGRDMLMPMLRISLPIYRKKTNAKLREIELLQEANQLEKETTQDQLTLEWAETLQGLSDAKRKTSLYQEQQKLAEQSIQLLLAAFATQGQGMEEILRIQRQILELERNELRSIVRQHILIAKLEALAATDLSTKN